VSLVEVERPAGPAGQITQDRLGILGQCINELEVVLVTEIFLSHIDYEIVDVSPLIDGRFTEDHSRTLGLQVVGTSNVIHSTDMREQKVVLNCLAR